MSSIFRVEEIFSLLAGLAEIVSSTPKMETICSSETSVAYQQTTRRHIPEDDTLHNHHCENLKSCTSTVSVFQLTLQDYGTFISHLILT
jgi:hypothetical protein